MSGRGDARHQSRGGGRGRFGRGQGEAHKSNVKGTFPEVGAYLDLPRGQTADPEAVLKWLEGLRIYMYAKYESRIKEIIGIDGVLNDYPEPVRPADPPEGAGQVAMENWKSDKREYTNQIKLLEQDTDKSYGVLMEQMSNASKARIKEMPRGEIAINECDPLGVLTCVIATHMNNKRYGDMFNKLTAIENFYANKMLPHEDLATYYARCRTLLFVKDEGYRLAEEDSPEHTDEFYALRFISHLNSNFSDYINMFKQKVRPWPRTMADAHADAANYLMSRGPQGGNQGNQEKRNVLAASRGGKAGGRGGRKKGNEKSESETKGSDKKGRSSTPYRERDESPHGEKTGSVQEYGTRYGKCNKCHEEGHYGYECRNPDKAGKKSAAAWNSSSEK